MSRTNECLQGCRPVVAQFDVLVLRAVVHNGLGPSLEYGDVEHLVDGLKSVRRYIAPIERGEFSSEPFSATSTFRYGLTDQALIRIDKAVYV